MGFGLKKPPFTALELFAGVGGFRVALEQTRKWRVIWSNQWEPGERHQHASRCYTRHFGQQNHFCEDIRVVLDRADRQELELPNHDLLVGGFPCQDFSVAKPLNQAYGLTGQKGELWWQIDRVIQRKQPRF